MLVKGTPRGSVSNYQCHFCAGTRYEKEHFYPSLPSAVYTCKWIGSALVQIMACRLFGTKPSHYLNQCWNIVNWALMNKVQWNLNRNSYIFIQENASENIFRETAAILSRGRWVNVFSEQSAREGLGDDICHYMVCIYIQGCLCGTYHEPLVYVCDYVTVGYWF